MVISSAIRQRGKRFVIEIGLELIVRNIVRNKMTPADIIIATRIQVQRYANLIGLETIAPSFAKEEMIQEAITLVIRPREQNFVI